MHQGKFHLLAIFLIPAGIVLFGLVNIWWINVLYVLIAATLIYFLFRSKTKK